MPAFKVPEPYRSRAQIESAFRDLKHGIDRKPAGCRNDTAGSLCEELSPFSLTVSVKKGEPKRRIISNFGPLIGLIQGRKRPENR